MSLFQNRPECAWDPPSLLFDGYRNVNNSVVKQIFVPNLRMSGAVHLFPFMVLRGTNILYTKHY